MKPAKFDIRKLEGILNSRIKRTITIEEMNAANRAKATIYHKATKIKADPK